MGSLQVILRVIIVCEALLEAAYTFLAILLRALF